MGLLSWLFGQRKEDPATRLSPTDNLNRYKDEDGASRSRKAPTEYMINAGHSAPHIRWREDSYPLDVVGESNYQDALIAIAGRYTREGDSVEVEAELVREPSNPHDPNAVAVRIQRRTVGYLSRDQAVRVGGQMREEGLSVVVCSALIRGGWRTNQYDEGLYGVRLAVPSYGWIDLGTGAKPPEKVPAPRRKIERPEPVAVGPLTGQRIAIMGGLSDAALAQELADAGAKIMSGVGTTTTMLVIASERPFTPGERASAGFRKAEQNGIRIVSAREAREMTGPTGGVGQG